MTSAAVVLSCGNCGADVAVASVRSLVVTCDHCNTLLRRTDVALEALERVSFVTPLASQFQRGTTGALDGVRFEVRGQIQLDHGAGPWNEWAAELADGGWIWIAEAQGELLVFQESELSGDGDEERIELLLPRIDVALDGDPDDGRAKSRPLRAGETVLLGYGKWTVTEVGEGSVVTCQGELPVRPAVGSRTRYVDLADGLSKVATLDVTRETPEWLPGRRVSLVDLQLDPSSQPEHTPARVEAVRIRCSHCDGELSVQDPEHALRIGCEHCERILERDDGVTGPLEGDLSQGELTYRTLEAQKRVEARSPLPLGARGSLLGEELTVLGAMQRRVKADGRWYPWREVLLRTSEGAYRWLVESDGHWSYARPIAPSAVKVGGGVARFNSRRHKHFAGGQAEVHWVVGEFYWRVERGERVHADDYVDVRHGRAVSLERSDTELVASESVHVDRDDVAAAFGAQRLPSSKGVGMLSPNHSKPRETLAFCGLGLTALIALLIFFQGSHAREVLYESQLGPTPTTKNEELVVFSDPFAILRSGGNVQVQLRAPSLNQGWIGLTGALVEMDTGAVTTFATSAQYYSGRSGGESWSEGNRRGTAWIGRVPSGTYRLRLAAQGWDKGLGANFSVRVRSQVPRLLWFFLALVPLLLIPFGSFLRWIVFEQSRWSKSDHPWNESS